MVNLLNLKQNIKKYSMNIALHIFLILISFAIAFLGVVVLFSVDVFTGGILATGGIVLAIKSMEV